MLRGTYLQFRGPLATKGRARPIAVSRPRAMLRGRIPASGQSHASQHRCAVLRLKPSFAPAQQAIQFE